MVLNLNDQTARDVLSLHTPRNSVLTLLDYLSSLEEEQEEQEQDQEQEEQEQEYDDNSDASDSSSEKEEDSSSWNVRRFVILSCHLIYNLRHGCTLNYLRLLLNQYLHLHQPLRHLFQRMIVVLQQMLKFNKHLSLKRIHRILFLFYPLLM